MLHAEGLPPVQITVQQPCNQFCNPRKNQDGLCPLLCLPLCFSTCKQTLLLPQDPPPPPDFTSSAAHHPVTHFRVSIFLPVFLLILATACFLFSCYTVHKFRKNWRSGSSRTSEGFSDSADEDDGVTVDDNPIWYIRTVGLQSTIINAITVCRYKRGEGLVEGTECGVCLNEFEEDQSVRLLPKCSHAFHIACIDTWLRSHTNCPMCRAGIITNTSVQDSSTSSRESIGMGRENREDLEEGRAVLNGQISRNEEVRGGLVVNSAADEAQATGIKKSASMDFVPERVKEASSSSLIPVLVKRSLSCGGKIFSAQYNRSHNAIILPR